MEKMQYAEELVREFLVFRGFTNTLEAYEAELRTDIGKGFEVEKILDLIFSLYVPKFQADKLVALLGFFKRYLSSSETPLVSTLSKLETSLLRFYVVHALQCNRIDKVVEFFALSGTDLLQRSQDWSHWFAIPYIKNPHLDPDFRIFFSKEWYQALHLSARNFFSEVFNGTRLPALLKISSEINATNLLKRDIVHLNLKLSQLQALLDEKEAQLSQFRSMEGSINLASNLHEGSTHVSKDPSEVFPTVIPRVGQTDISQDSVVGAPGNIHSDFISSRSGDHSTSLSSDHLRNGGAGNTTLKENDGEEDFAEVKVEHQETFLGHTSSISRCRFSASGNNIASASMDGTVRIWTYDTSTPVSRNATIYCGSEVLSLDWECKSDRLLLIGTADGCIKAWNVDAKRVVCDLNTTEAFPSVLDIKCSPVEPIFVSAAASGGAGSNYCDNLGFASLTVWNMKLWKAMTVLPLGEDPPAITSLCFNHNGKILAASAVDGMIHMFDMSSGLQITGWPAHDSSISSILFGPDETSIFSLGSDGKIFEWSLQNQGQILWSRDCSRFCYPFNGSKCSRHEMALDANGRRLLVTSSSVRAPIYQVQGHLSGWRTLPHGAHITTVDWHPTLPIFLTGSADNSVRVTSLS
ncbi:WD repeat-containing protein 91 homolog isoform X2 [Abrus precatorius]|uniref:WD repeat-containing protein 91 homolog isoform X2 n=1 Tax=Abrus precatorius TaxID=3816 RepID=A0A8B8M4N2_ABRPR|nr:WD repeat-containing protein 91 homolog isoform X2 [Abrus precatorius]